MYNEALSVYIGPSNALVMNILQGIFINNSCGQHRITYIKLKLKYLVCLHLCWPYVAQDAFRVEHNNNDSVTQAAFNIISVYHTSLKKCFIN